MANDKMTIKPQARWVGLECFVGQAKLWNKQHPEDPINLDGLKNIEITDEQLAAWPEKFKKMFLDD